MGIEVNTTAAICSKCGRTFSRRKGYFPVSYALLHKGVGHTHICKECIDALYDTYLSQCDNPKDAVRQVCRKLDLYFNEAAFEAAERKYTTRTVMTGYIAKINGSTFAGKSYDNTLSEEGSLWHWRSDNNKNDLSDVEPESIDENTSEASEKEDEIFIPEDVRAFWGPGYSPEMYLDLEQRRSYWISKFPSDIEIDIGTEALIRQVCNLEIDINRDRAAGKSIDKSVGALNSLLGSMNLKPTQKKSDDGDATLERTPFGVWIRRWENQRPIPEVDPELRDVDGIVRYIDVWFRGHLCKMLGIKNSYSRMYEEEIAKIRVEHPEYDEDDDEDMIYDLFGEKEE